MDFNEKLEVYAELIVKHGLNVQKGQSVYINSEIIHRDFVYKIAEQAYKVGAKYVHLDFIEPKLTRLRILESKKEEDLNFVPKHIPSKYDEMLDDCAASLRILGSEDPDVLSDLDPKKVNNLQLSYRKSLKRYYEEGVGKSKVHWSIAAASTPAWGKKVYPEMSPENACDALWEDIFKICRADKPNCLELWKEHNTVLHNRSKYLNDLAIKELHFTGPGTDLKVGLSEKAIFKGGGDKGPFGVEYEPNIPTEECFTTPDYRKTNGCLQATRPFLINGKLIKDLTIEFKDGVISNFDAKEGKETFAEYISSDVGAKRLGEVALVGIDSPIYQSGRIFEEILFDENAACHVAVGFAYRFCIDGGDKMTPEELESVGCNDSHVHTDMMISSEQVDVTAVGYSGEKTELIKAGQWV